ncbi:MAG: hypothetical protein HQK54_08920 [Oligoflexales bacterium]|nr:hypothetical protein [Oligoflexales bacterium]
MKAFKFISLLIVVSLSGCSGRKSKKDDTGQPTPTQQPEPTANNPDGSSVPTQPPSSTDQVPPPAGAEDASSSLKKAIRDIVMELKGKPDFLIGLGHTGGGGFADQGIKIDIYYAYLCCGYADQGWAGWQPEGRFVDSIVKIADDNGAVPMFTYYQLALVMEQTNYRIFESEDLVKYLKDVKLMYTRLGAYGKSSMVHFEPDFFGYLQQHVTKNSLSVDTMKAVIHGSDFHDCDHLNQTVAGLLQCLIDMGRKLSPKTKIAFSSSSWGDWYDDSNPNVDVAKYAASVGAFLNKVSMGKTDFVIVETLDRDAGFHEIQNPKGKYYWDESNKTYPNFQSHLKWVKALVSTMGKPAVFWQTPLGVPSDTRGGSNGAYRDNRVRYFFSHINELVDAGVFGALFGAGADGQTTIKNDGGQFKNAAAAYMSSPYEIK